MHSVNFYRNNQQLCTLFRPKAVVLLESGWGVFSDEYPAVGYFHPINLYPQLQVAHVHNLEPISCM